MIEKTSYTLLIKKLDEFIRKYYINKLLRGVIYTSTVVLGVYLLVTFSEYQFYFSTAVRTVLFFGFILTMLFISGYWMGVPLMKYYRLGKTISHEQASLIIGQHFTNVQDKLLNVLQLKHLSVSVADNSLIEASINQKIETLKPVPFVGAINLSKNRRYLKYLAAPVFVLIFIVFAAPSILSEGTKRLLNHNTEYEKKMPFQFSIQNKKLETLQYTDYEMSLKVNGDALPDEVSVYYEDISYKLIKKTKNEFSYVFTRPQKSFDFHFEAGGFQSKNYKLDVLPKPVILKFETALQYPGYIGRQNEVIKNTGDLNIPQGTKIDWTFFSQNTDQLSIRIGNKVLNATPENGNEFRITQQLMQDKPYTIFVSNEKSPNADSMNFSITVIPDMYPAISVTPMEDSLNRKYLYFAGDLSDDYGLKKLTLNYSISNDEDQQASDEVKSIPIPFTPGKKSDFSQSWDLEQLALKPGDKLSYFFEIWDNDGVNGSKSTKTNSFTFEVPTMKEFEKQHDLTNEQIKNQMEKVIKEADQLQKDFDKLNEKLQDKKNLDWNDKKEIQDLLNQQKKMQDQVQQTQQMFKENSEQMKDFKEFDPELQNKQKQLDDLFNNVLSPEMKNMVKKLNDMMNQMNKDKTLDELKKNQVNTDDLKKEMDRMLSLFKQLEFDQKYEDVTKKLDSLAAEQDALNKQTDNKDNKKNDSLDKKQDDLNKKFDDIKKDIDKLNELNKELEDPMQMPDTKEKKDQIQNDMKNSSDNLKSNDSKNASKNQKNAKEKMEQLSDQLQQAKEDQQQEQEEQDMNKIRQLLENLIKVSFKQEELIDLTKKVNIYNPQYLELMKKQNDLKDDLKMIEDSITELAKTQFQMKSYVAKQVKDIESNLDKAVYNLELRVPSSAASNQQYIMTSVNNLALMFEEMMQSMQEAMKSNKPGSGKCNKPGGNGTGKPSFSQMKQSQKQLMDKMGEMMDGMKNGNKPGSKPGEKPGNGSGQSMSEQFAKMAQQQSMIRQAMQQMADQMQPGGQQAKEMKEMQEQMNAIEKQLVNKQIDENMLKKQNELYNKLLEFEKAEKTQGEDDKRKSNTGSDMIHSVPPAIDEYLKKKQTELELYKTVPPGLSPFYKNLVEDYFKQINQ